MPVLGAATLELNADSAKLEQDLGRAVGQAAAFGTMIGEVMGQAITKGVEKLVAMVEKAIETGDELNKLSQKTGMTVEYLSQLRVAAELSNVSLGVLKTGVKQLYENLSTAGRTDGKAKSAIEAIGLDVEQLRALKPDELFRAVTEQLAKYEDGANRSALQTAILGRSGAELTPLINELGKTTAIAQQLGITMDKETTEASERFRDNMKIAQLATEAIGGRIAQVLLPTLEKLSGYLVENAKNTERLDTVSRTADAGLKLFATAGTVVAAVFGIVGDKVAAAFATASLVLKGEFSEALKTASGTVVNTGQKIGEAVAEIQGIWEDAGAKAQAGAEANGKKLAAPAIEAVERIKKARKEADGEFAAFLKIRAIEDEAQAATQNYYRTVGQQIEEAQARTEKIRENAIETEAAYAKALDSFRKGKLGEEENVATSIEEVGAQAKKTDDFARQMGLTFSSAFEDAIIGGKTFSDVLKGLAQDVERIILRKSVTEPLGNAVSGAISGGGLGDWFKNLFRADGGPVGMGQPYIVGERGPELFVPGTSGTIVPNGAGGGGPVFNINMPGATLEAVQRVESMVYRLNGSIESRALSAVQDAQLRGNRV